MIPTLLFYGYMNPRMTGDLLRALIDNGYSTPAEYQRVNIFIEVFAHVAELHFETEGSMTAMMQAYDLAAKVLLEEKVYFGPNVFDPLLSYLRTCHRTRFESAIGNYAKNFALIPYATTWDALAMVSAKYNNFEGLFID